MPTFQIYDAGQGTFVRPAAVKSFDGSSFQDRVVRAHDGSQFVAVFNQQPSASFTTSTTDLTVDVDASGSGDIDGTIDRYEWEWGDGTTGSGETASHTYDSDGEYTITLSVTDDVGATAQTTETVSVSTSTDAEVLRWDVYELSLTNTGSYSNSEMYRMDLTATFTGPSDQSITVRGFWDGGDTFRIRFAPPEAGDWSYTTTSSEASLDGQSGSFTASTPTQSQIEANPNLRGFLRPVVSNDSRYYEYADGTPFLYAAGSLWDGNSRQMPFDTDFQQYVDDRAAKGFTAIQLLLQASHVDYNVGTRENGINECGPFFGGTANDPDFTEINPDHFSCLDDRLAYIHDTNGMVPNLWFGWAGQFDVMSTAQLEDYYQYIVARYGAYNVMFTTSGEYPNSSYYPNTAKMTDSASHASSIDGLNHPTSIHPDNDRISSSTDFAGDAWIDHHTLQTGAATGHDVQNLEDDWSIDDVPVLNAEPHVANNFGATRIKVRRDPWQALTSGLAAGVAHLYYPIAYDYYTIDDLDNHIDAPETLDISVAYRFFTRIRWHELVPAQGLIVSGQSDSESSLKVASHLPDGSLQLVYYSDNSSAEIDLSPISTVDAAVTWFNTVDESTVSEGTYSTSTTHAFTPPSGWSDGLLIAESL